MNERFFYEAMGKGRMATGEAELRELFAQTNIFGEISAQNSQTGPFRKDERGSNREDNVSGRRATYLGR